MLALLVSVTVVSAAPRGLTVKDPVELVTQVDARLAKWMTHGGDWKAVLANKKEVTAHVGKMPVQPADRKAIIAATIEGSVSAR